MHNPEQIVPWYCHKKLASFGSFLSPFLDILFKIFCVVSCIFSHIFQKEL